MSNRDDQGGSKVLQEVVQMTGLPEDYLEAEISQLLGLKNSTGASVNNLSLEQLRSVLLNYLETLNATIEQEIAQEPETKTALVEDSKITQTLIKH